MRRLLAVCILLFYALPVAPAAARPLALRIDAVLEPLAERGDFSGAVVVTRSGLPVYARGFGLANREQATPFTPMTPSDGGSIAKPITAAAILLLAAEGRLDLDTPVRRYLPLFGDSSATVRQLLSHSAGLPDYGAFQPLLDSGRPVGNADLLAQARTVAPDFAPGARFTYCNLCYDALAEIVARVSGQSYAAFVQSRFFRPLTMPGAFIRPARFEDWTGVRTRGYRLSASGWQPNDAFDNEGFHGGSNIYLSALDLSGWTAAWSVREGLPKAVFATATQAAWTEAGPTGLTLGNWYCRSGGARCYYRGAHQGFHAFAYWDSRRRISVAFVSNASLSAALQVDLPRALVALAEGRSPAAIGSARASSGEQLPPGNIVGAWRGPGGRLDLRLDGKTLVLRRPGSPPYRVYPTGWRTLYAPGLEAYITLEGDRLRLRSVFGDQIYRRASNTRTVFSPAASAVSATVQPRAVSQSG